MHVLKSSLTRLHYMSVTKFLVLISGVLVEVCLAVIGYCFVGIGDFECSWLSSFVEVSIGLNGALAITRVRRWLRNSFASYCNNLIESRLKEKLVNFGEGGNQLFAEVFSRILKRFDRRLNIIGRYAAVSGVIFASVALLLLLSGCDNRDCWPVVLLLSPFVVFYTASYVCYICVQDHFREIACDLGAYDNVEMDNERAGFMELKRKIDTLNREYGSQGKGS